MGVVINMIRKRLMAAMFFVFIILTVTACHSGVNNQESGASTQNVNTNSSAQDLDTKSIAGWDITLISCEVTDDLSATKSAVQYDGDAVEVSLNEKPSSGNIFVLVEMIIEKVEAGSEKFEWGRAFVLDEEGNEYARHTNDTFLENFNFPRIKSIDLTFGKNEGFVCYELPIETTKESLFFVYEGIDGNIKIRLR